MSSRGRDKTGGNTEPMPFVRKFGAAAVAAAAAGESTIIETSKSDDNVSGDNVGASISQTAEVDSSHSRSRSRSDRRDKEKRDKRKKSSHSRERSKRRSKSRERRRRSRSRSHERRSRSRSRSKRRRSRSRDRRSRSYSARSRSRGRRSQSHSHRSKHRRERSSSPLKEGTPADVDQEQQQPLGSNLPPKPKVVPGVLPLLVRPDIVETLTHEKPANEAGDAAVKEKKPRKSRWSTTKSFVPGMPTILPSNLKDEQRQAYLLQLEVEDATRKLRLGDFMGNPDPALRLNTSLVL